MKTGVIIQARMGSARLYGKVMAPLKGHSILYHIITRVKQAALVDEIIVATTRNACDDVIVREVQRSGARCFRGSEDHVLSRYYLAAKENYLDVIIRITGDCPLIDPKLIDLVIERFMDGGRKLATNAGLNSSTRTYPRGLDVEVFSMDLLEDAYFLAKEKRHIEHVTPYMYELCENIDFLLHDKDYSNHRWTVDTKADLSLVRTVYAKLYHGVHDFYLEEIIELFSNHPELILVNAHIKQKTVDE